MKIRESDAQYRERLIDAIPAGAVYTAEDIGNSVGDYLDKIGAAFGCLRHGVAIDEARKLNGAQKNDKAHKAWLAGLKDGDEAAVIDDDGACHGVGIVYRYKSRDEISLGSFRFTAKIGRSSLGHYRATGFCWLVPVTDELRAAASKRKAVDETEDQLSKVRFTQWRQFTDDQLLAVSAILWPEQSK